MEIFVQMETGSQIRSIANVMRRKQRLVLVCRIIFLFPFRVGEAEFEDGALVYEFSLELPRETK